MDQLKEFLKQAVKYRFWIATGIASLLPLIAYFVGTGALAEAEKAQTAKIKGANTDAGKFAAGGVVQNPQWKKVVDEKKALLATDVVKAHTKLYAVQAPLLDWPSIVAEDFTTWGEKYPEGIDVQKINDKILDYTQVYNEYVDTVYKTFKPFDLKTGEGIVAAPSKEALLRPVVFREETRPSLSDVWAAQRKLWIERTMFDVIAKVNSKAKSWDDAPIKQIVMLEVANALALDQKTAAKEGELIPAPAIAGDPLAAAPAEAATTTTSTSSRSALAGGLGGLGGASAAPSGPEPVEFVKSPNPDQYYIVPVALSVYIEQDRIPDLLVEFRNSPMSIRVLDFQMKRPTTPVKKPKKGEETSAFDGAMGSSRGLGGMGGGLSGGMGGDGGGGAMTLESMLGGNKAYNNRMKGQGPMMGGRGAESSKPKAREGGQDLAKKNIEDRKKKREKKDGDTEKEKSKADDDEASAITNPYFNVVQVTIRGQARFYKPPAKLATPPSTSTPGTATPEPAKAEAPKADMPKDAAKAEAPKPDAAKADAPKADATKGDAPKADAGKPDAPKADVPKADASKADAPKTDAVTGDAPKADAPKGDAPKTDAPKADAPKPKTDGEKPKS